jgi:hypothetical protein
VDVLVAVAVAVGTAVAVDVGGADADTTTAGWLLLGVADGLAAAVVGTLVATPANPASAPRV